MVVIYSMEDEETIPCLSSDSVFLVIGCIAFGQASTYILFFILFLLHLIFFEGFLAFFCGAEESEDICM